MDKQAIKEKLDMAFRLISSIQVKGEAVDIMAAARQQIRDVFLEIQKGESEDGR